MRHILLTLVLALLAQTSLAEPPEWLKDVPPLQWHLLDQHQFGNRVGAKHYWFEKEQKLLLMGGLPGDSRREPKRPANMIFDLKTKTWSEYKGEPKLPPALNLTITDKAKRLKITVVLPKEAAKLAGERVALNSPLEGESKIFVGNGELPALIGALTFFDPVNNEVHLIGGSAPGLPSGYAGNWVYSVEKNSWRKWEDPPGIVKLRNTIDELARDQRDFLAAARNIYYSELPATETAEKAKKALLPRADKLLERSKMLLPGFETLGETEFKKFYKDVVAKYLLGNYLDCGFRCADSSNNYIRAIDDLKNGVLTAKTLQNLQNAAHHCDSASQLLSSSPPSRRNASGNVVNYKIEDESFSYYLLFGGDHGDYTLGDTWRYDFKNKLWEPLDGPGLEPRYSAMMTNQGFLLGGQAHARKVQVQKFDELLPAEIWSYSVIKLFEDHDGWVLRVPAMPGADVLSSDKQPILRITNPVVQTEVDGDNVFIVPAVGGNDYHDFLVSSTWIAKLNGDKPKGAERPKLQDTILRRYRGERNPAYDPCWYDDAPHLGRPAMDKLTSELPPHTWVELPLAARPCPERSWGTSIFDPARDQIYVWSGGHSADPASIVHHYHPATHRWSIGYVADGGVLGNQLTGRPDCQNHTYKNYALDSVSGKLVALHRAATHIYDPDRRDWTEQAEQPFKYNLYESKCVATKHGVVAWIGGIAGDSEKRYFGLFDVKTKTWKPLTVEGVVPPNVHGDEAGMTYDSRRDVLYLHVAGGYEKPDGRIHRYDFASGKLTVLSPEGLDAIGNKFHQYRETVYLPQQDMILFGMGWVDGKQVAYDVQKNRYRLLPMTRVSRAAKYDEAKESWTFAEPKKNDHVGSISFAPVYDAKRNVLWAPSDYKSLFVLKLDKQGLIGK